MDGYNWKGKVLKAFHANPAHDPLMKKRRQEFENGDPKIQKTVAESSESLGHLPYEEQLGIKYKKIEEVLKTFKFELRKANNIQKRSDCALTDDLICELRPIVPSPKTAEYRNKCEFTIGKTASGQIMVGQRISSYVSGCLTVGSVEDLKMPTDKMKLATKLLCKYIEASEIATYNPENYEGHFRNLTIRQTQNGGFMMMIGIHPQKMTREEKEKLQKDFVHYFTVGDGSELKPTSIYYEEIQKRQSGQHGNVIKHIYGDTHIKESLLGLDFRISPNSFFQANSFGAERLYQVAIDLAAVDKTSTIIDICCGTGTIGLCFAKYVKQVLGVEIIPEAIADAKVNAKANGITNAQFTAGNSDDLIFSCVKQANVEDGESVVAIVDPPRAGLQTKSIVQLRNSQKIKRLVYISCSPTQVMKNFVDLCKNCSKTMKGEPFIPKIAVPVDLFPHTPHCELVILFERAEEPKVEITQDKEDTNSELAGVQNMSFTED